MCLDLRRKSDRLMEEAVRDLECGCYNKAVSAAYFSVRMLAEHMMPGLRTSKDDKIANALKRMLSREVGEDEAERIRSKFLSLFEARKRADHRPFMFEEDEARFFVEMAMEIRDMLKSLGRGD